MTLGAIIAISSALIWPFPDRLSAYVWRNWTIVPKERLAAVIGAEPADLVRIAAEMGLPDQGRIAPEWDTLGRKSVIRRNWNLVPRSQWTKLVPPDPRRHSNTGEADEYLKWHLGGGKSHELGRGPKLLFEMNDAQAARIREGECRQAVGAYRKVRTDWAEAGFWNDPHLGDPAFYKEVVVPYLRKLDAPAERVVRLEATAEDYAAYFQKYALEWSDLRIMINRKRQEYLEKRFFED